MRSSSPILRRVVDVWHIVLGPRPLAPVEDGRQDRSANLKKIRSEGGVVHSRGGLRMSPITSRNSATSNEGVGQHVYATPKRLGHFLPSCD
jgi:hypothetical protein